MEPFSIVALFFYFCGNKFGSPLHEKDKNVRLHRLRAAGLGHFITWLIEDLCFSLLIE